MIGNGVTDKYFDGNAAVPFAHGMGLISDDLYQVIRIVVAKTLIHHLLKPEFVAQLSFYLQEIVDVCHGSYLTPSSEKCQSKLNKFKDVISFSSFRFENIFLFSIRSLTSFFLLINNRSSRT